MKKRNQMNSEYLKSSDENFKTIVLDDRSQESPSWSLGLDENCATRLGRCPVPEETLLFVYLAYTGQCS